MFRQKFILWLLLLNSSLFAMDNNTNKLIDLAINNEKLLYSKQGNKDTLRISFINEAKNNLNNHVDPLFITYVLTLHYESSLYYQEKNDEREGFINKEVLEELRDIFIDKVKNNRKGNLRFCAIQDPRLLSTLIYECDILNQSLTPVNQLVSKAFETGVNIGSKIVNLVKKKESKIKNCSKTVLQKTPLLPLILDKAYKEGFFIDNDFYKKIEPYKWFKQTTGEKALPQSTIVFIHYLKTALTPPSNHPFKLEEFEGEAKKKVIVFLLCLKPFMTKELPGKKFPNPLKIYILKMLANYNSMQKIRKQILTDVTLLNLAYLDESEDIEDHLKGVVEFIKNDLMPWFDKEAQK